MKKLALLIGLLMLVSVGCGEKFNKNEPDGIFGLKWADTAETGKQLGLIYNRNDLGGGTLAYLSTKKAIGDVETGIRLKFSYMYFFKNQFGSMICGFDIKDTPIIFEILVKKYGEPVISKLNDAGLEFRRWEFKNSNIILTEVIKDGKIQQRLHYTYVPIMKGQFEDNDKAVRDL